MESRIAVHLVAHRPLAEESVRLSEENERNWDGSLLEEERSEAEKQAEIAEVTVAAETRGKLEFCLIVLADLKSSLKFRMLHATGKGMVERATESKS